MYTDLLIRIKNAQSVNKGTVFSPFSKIDWEILKILVKYNYLEGIDVKKNNNKPFLKINLNKKRFIQGIKFISVPSKKVFLKVKDIKPVKQGKGVLVLSTSSGIMTGSEAKKKKIGGQALFEIW